MQGIVKLAVETEKTFNNNYCNQLLLTLVDDHVLSDKLKSIHKSVKNVNVLQPPFIPQTRYIVEVTDVDDVASVMNSLMEHNFEGRQVQIKLLDNNGYLDLDPYKLEVRNLPSSISNNDLKQLFPASTDYTFLAAQTNASTRTVIVHFENVQDAISSFKTRNLMKYKDNVLSLKFVRKNVSDRKTNTCDKKRPHTDNIVSRIKTEGIAQANKQMTDTLIVHNLPSTMEEKEIVTLFPALYRYKFFQKTASKSCIIYFKTVPEALASYTNCDKIYMSHTLQVDFYDKELDEGDYGASKTARLSRDISMNQQRRERISSNPNNLIFEQSVKKEFEHQSENKEENRTLRVKNLPINTTEEDLHHLFPKHCKHQLKVEETEECASALVCFLTSTAASSAYKSMQNKIFRGRVLSINIKSKPCKVNPFAVRNANNSNPKQTGTLNSGTTQNGTPPSGSCTYVLTDTNGAIVAEDDVECKYEDNYIQEDDLEVDSDTIDYDSEEEIHQAKGLADSILPFDED